MKIGEFFVQLGVKGAEKTVGALSSIRTGMSDLGAMSLEAKAAILATAYALERLMASSGKTGTELTNFNALTGISAQTLQQYQFAAAQVGISNEEIASSFKSVQNVMTSMRFGKGAPEGMAMMMETLQRGGESFDPNRAKTDIEYVMRKLQEYANLEKDISKRNLVMKSFGLGENVVAGMARNAFRPEVFKQAPIFTDKETNQLDKVNAAFNNLGIKIKMAAGHFTAMHGGQLVKELSQLVDVVLKLANAFVKLAEHLKLFEGIGKVFEGWAKIFELVDSSVQSIGDAFSSDPEKKEKGQNDIGGFFKEMPGVFKAAIGDYGDFLWKNQMAPATGGAPPKAAPPSYVPASKPVSITNNNNTRVEKSNKAIAPSISSVLKPSVSVSPILNNANKVAPAISPLANTSPGNSQTNHVSQTFNFQNDGTAHKQVGNETQKAITKAFYQIQQGGI